jgi:hypothetical protein
MSLARLAPWYDVDDAATLRRAAREAAATGCPALAAALEPLASKLG